MFVRLLDRPDDEILDVIKRWIEGDGDDFDELMDLLLSDQAWWSDRPIARDDPRDPEAHLAHLKARHLIERRMMYLTPTPLNFQRVEKWCAATESIVGYEVLLRTFEHMLSGECFDELIAEAEALFTPEYVRLWCASRPQSRTHPERAGLAPHGVTPAKWH